MEPPWARHVCVCTKAAHASNSTPPTAHISLCKSHLQWEILSTADSKCKTKQEHLRDASAAQGKVEMEKGQRPDSLQNEWRRSQAQATEAMLSIQFNHRTWKYYFWQSSSVPSKAVNYKRGECIRWKWALLSSLHTRPDVCLLLCRTLDCWTAFTVGGPDIAWVFLE